MIFIIPDERIILDVINSDYANFLRTYINRISRSESAMITHQKWVRECKICLDVFLDNVIMREKFSHYYAKVTQNYGSEDKPERIKKNLDTIRLTRLKLLLVFDSETDRIEGNKYC